MNLPKVSVIMITFGHELYIEKAIKSVLSQKGNFQIELIISNDNSPDNSDILIRKCIENTPNNFQIKYTKHSKNKGIMPNFYQTLLEATGDYIALCDGDDYWTDENKIQKQLDFLNTNKDCVLVAHNVRIFDNDTKATIVESFPFTEPTAINKDFIYKKNYVPALSILYRNIEKVPIWILESPIGDYPLVLFLSKLGKIGFLQDNMADYRSNAGYHSTASKTSKNQMLIVGLETVLKNIVFNPSQTETLNYQLLRLKLQDGSISKKLVQIGKSSLNAKNKAKLFLQLLK